MANDAVGQRIQRDDIFQKANILSFQGLTASFAIQQGVYSAKGSLTCKDLLNIHKIYIYIKKKNRDYSFGKTEFFLISPEVA